MAASGLSLKISATPTSAAAGDIVTFTISVNATTPKDFGGIEFKLDIPSGLEYQSGTFDSNFKAQSQADADCSYTESSKIVIATTSDGFENLSNLNLLTFSCKVAEGASGSLVTSLKDVVINDREYYEVDSSGYTITPATVTIAKAPITSVSAVVATPKKNQALGTIVTVDPAGKYSGTVQWYEGGADSTTPASGTAGINAVYTAKITLTAKDGETFATSLNNTTTAEDYKITRTSDTELILTKTFPATETRALESIAVDTGLTVAVPVALPNQTATSTVTLTATGTYDNGTSDAVNATWEIVGDAPTGVSIIEGNKLQVTNEVTAATSVTVKATVGDKSNTGTVSITRDTLAVTNIVATALAEDRTVNVAATPQTTNNAPTAEVYDQYGKKMDGKTVEWAISGTAPTGVSIDAATGKLTVDKTAQEGTVDIYAKIGTVESDKLTYFIKRAASTATTVTIKDGVESLTVPTVDAIGGSASMTAETAFTAEVKDQFGEVMSGASVTWSVSGNPDVSISNTGLLTITN